MKRDMRYGAALVLAVLFFSFFLLSRSDFFARRSPANAAPLAAPTAAESGLRGIVPGFPVNINTATAEELMMLPGIGSATAERILEKREELGGFTSVDQLTEVRWVGTVKVERLRSMVTIE